jgi:hypothetical protein
MKIKKQVLSFGGGRQSCAIAALIIAGKLPKPDITVIANTGRERLTTFPYLQKHVIPALRSVGVELNVINAAEWSYYGTRYVDGSGDLMLPVFMMDGAKAVKNKPDCSGAWKRDAINRWLSKTHGVTRSKYVKWIGFSTNPKEMARAARMARSKKEGGDKTRFPLIELRISTEDCLRIVRDIGWPEPKVSACWMCPNLRDSERAELSDEEKALAIKFDEEMRGRFPGTFIHGSMRPLAEVNLDKRDEIFTESCDSGNCFV